MYQLRIKPKDSANLSLRESSLAAESWVWYLASCSLRQNSNSQAMLARISCSCRVSGTSSTNMWWESRALRYCNLKVNLESRYLCDRESAPTSRLVIASNCELKLIKNWAYSMAVAISCSCTRCISYSVTTRCTLLSLRQQVALCQSTCAASSFKMASLRLTLSSMWPSCWLISMKRSLCWSTNQTICSQVRYWMPCTLASSRSRRMKSIQGRSRSASSLPCAVLHRFSRYAERSSSSLSSCTRLINYNPHWAGKRKWEKVGWDGFGKVLLLVADNSNQTMGSANTKQSASWLTQRYNFIENLTLPHFGMVAVFKKRQENYDYIGLLEKSVRVDYSKEIQRELCFLTGKNIALPFLKIFMVEVGQLDLHDSLLSAQRDRRGRCGVQLKEQKLSIYMELLNYTLQEHVAYKRESKSQITLKEYCYVIKTVIAAAMLYEEWKLDYLQLDLTSDCIFLKPNGEIKLLPFKSNYMREAPECGEECLHSGCLSNCEGGGEFRTYSFASPKKKEGKYLKQIKNLSLQLFSTVNPNVSAYVRSIPNFNRSFLLSYQELQVLRGLQYAVINSKSLREIYEILGEMQQDFLQVQRQQSTAQVQISNPEVYQAFVQHLSSASKDKQENTPPVSKHQQVTRNIFGVQPSADSQSNTHSNLSPRSQLRSSFKKCLEKQPSITVPAYFQ